MDPILSMMEHIAGGTVKNTLQDCGKVLFTIAKSIRSLENQPTALGSILIP